MHSDALLSDTHFDALPEITQVSIQIKYEPIVQMKQGPKCPTILKHRPIVPYNKQKSGVVILGTNLHHTMCKAEETITKQLDKYEKCSYFPLRRCLAMREVFPFFHFSDALPREKCSYIFSLWRCLTTKDDHLGLSFDNKLFAVKYFFFGILAIIIKERCCQNFGRPYCVD
ncbi:hypothetical protein Fot_38053 [Forsythia ovata]|uniref:Uncharacterized protein n=1 Tax=Forsythia ovata TaxID=205694 RepID=A0ABD1S1F8_9LAMI